MKILFLTTCFLLTTLGISSAQETSHFAFSVGGGFTTPVGTTGRYVNEGWNAGGGFGLNLNSWVGALIDLNYNSMGVNGATLNNFGVSNGGLHVLSATLDPIVHLTPKSHFDLYVTGGGGLYHRMQDYSVLPANATPGYSNPFFGFAPGQMVTSYSSNKPGLDAGVGIAFGSKWHGKFFAEAHYDRIIDNYHTDYVPVTFGFRW